MSRKCTFAYPGHPLYLCVAMTTEEPGYNQVRCTAFNQAQVNQIVAWCIEQLKNPKVCKKYYYAILFNIGIGLRFAELCGLRWSDIDFNNKVVIVSGQATLQYQMNEDLSFTNNSRQRMDTLKSHENARAIALTDFEVEIMNKVRTSNISDEFIFPMRYHTYNQKVKDVAKAIGLNPDGFRTHCLRATAATNLYNECHDLKDVQYMLGHTNTAMTSKYVYNTMSIEATRTARESTMMNTYRLA